MKRETLTDRRVKALRPAAKGTRYDVWDAIVPGLSLRVTENGRKSWTVVGRLNRKPIRVTIGPYPALGVADARTRAREKILLLVDGKNPRRSPRTTPTVKKALDDYLATRKWTDRYRASVDSALEKYIRPALDQLYIVDVERRDVRELVAAVDKEYPARAHSVLSYVSGFFTWAVDKELVAASPCAGMRAPSDLRSRDRVYSDPELRAIWAACETQPLRVPYGPFVKFLLVTAQRRSQGVYMKWTEVDDARGLWTSATKQKRLHPVPLSEIAREVLAGVPKRGEFVFSYVGKKPLNNLSYVARKVREAAGTPRDFRLHDLRRTAATRMAELGVSPWIVDAVLDHEAGGVTGVYQRYGYVEEMRHALSLWSNRLREILAGGTAGATATG